MSCLAEEVKKGAGCKIQVLVMVGRLLVGQFNIAIAGIKYAICKAWQVRLDNFKLYSSF